MSVGQAAHARIGSPIVVHSGPAPGPAPRRGRAQRWRFVHEAILDMQPGQWFRVPDPGGEFEDRSRGAEARSAAIGCIRRWLRGQGIEGVEVYQTIDREVVVRCGEGRAPLTRT